MIKFFEKNFQIQAHEFSRVQTFFAFLATISVFYTMGASIGDTLFLSYFGSIDSQLFLPWVYIGAGLTTILIAWLYDAIEHRFSRTAMITWSQTILAISIVVFRQLLLFGNRWIYYALIIWLETCALICLMLFFSFAGDFFTSRQARRLYGYINGGVAIGSLLGGYAIDVAVKWIKPENMLYACAGILICGAFQSAIIGQTAVAVGENELEPTVKKAPLSAIISNRYLQLIFIMVIATQLVSGLVDYQFKIVASQTMNDNVLAAFFGKFYSLLGLVQLAVQFVLVGWLLKIAGVVHSLLLLPILLIAGNTLFISHPVLATAAIANFARLTLLETLDEPAQELLFIPLAQRMRIRSQSLVEGGLLPLGICLTGAVLLVLSRVSNNIRYDPMLGIAFGCIWIASIILLFPQYRRTLAASLIKHQISPTDIYALLRNKDSVAVLSELLKSGDSKTILPVLEMLRGWRIEALASEIESLVVSDNESVAVAALELLGSDHRRSSLSKVRRAAYDLRPAVRSAAVLAACQIQGEDVVSKGVQWMKVPDAAVRRAAFLGLARYGGFDGRLLANKHLISILESSGREDRVEAIRLLGQVGSDGTTWIVRRFLDDPDPVLRKEAILAAGRLRDLKSSAKLLDLINDVHMRPLAVQALSAMPQTVGGQLSQRIKNSSIKTGARVSLARILGDMGGAEAVKILWELMGSKDDFLLRVTAGQSLCRLRTKDATLRFDLKGVDEHLENLCGDAALTAAACNATLKDNTLTARLLSDHFQLQKTLILSFLELQHDPRQFHRIQNHLLGDDEALRSNAIEFLDVSLPRSLAGRVIPLLDPHMDKVAGNNAALTDDLIHRLKRIDPWIRAIMRFHAIARHRPKIPPGDSIMDEQEEKLYQVFTTVTLLKQVDLFRYVPADYLATLAEVVEERNLYKGETLFSEGDPADALYFVCDGQILVTAGGKKVACLGPGQVIGEMALLDSQRRSATCVVEEDARLMRIPSESFNDLLSTQPAIAKGLLRTLVQRLRQSSIGIKS